MLMSFVVLLEFGSSLNTRVFFALVVFGSGAGYLVTTYLPEFWNCDYFHSSLFLQRRWVLSCNIGKVVPASSIKRTRLAPFLSCTWLAFLMAPARIVVTGGREMKIGQT